jgi:glyoxylase-like metal-dependent hydrolase (beta-lactamase superfamily II)
MKVLICPVGSLQTNCYIVVHEGAAAVIDPGADEGSILAMVAGEGAAVQSIVLTHGHADHVAAAAALKRLTGAPILAHAADNYLLRATDNQIARLLGLTEAVVPDRELSDGAMVALAGIDFAVLATPGHTPGSCCLYNAKELVLFAGDTLFRGGIGRSDLPGGDAKTLARSLARLKELPAEVEVYPGHGPATTIGRERMSNRYW